MLRLPSGNIGAFHALKRQAVVERMKPEQVEGLRTPLPAYVSRKYRQKIVDALGERLAPNPFIQPASTQVPSATRPAAAPAANPFTSPAAPMPASTQKAIKPTAAPNASARYLTEAPTVDDPSLTQFTFAKAPSSPATASSPTGTSTAPTTTAAPNAPMSKLNVEFATPNAESSSNSPAANTSGTQSPLTEEERNQFDEFVKDNSFSAVPFNIDFTPDQVRLFLKGIEKIRKKLKRRKLTTEDLMMHASVLLEAPLNPQQPSPPKG